MSYIIKMFLLVSSSVCSKQLLCFVHGQGQKSKQKHTTMNFVEFHNHFFLLTMLKSTNFSNRVVLCKRLPVLCSPTPVQTLTAKRVGMYQERSSPLWKTQ